MSRQLDPIRKQVMDLVEAERDRQMELFGERDDHSPERWIVILAEEFGEVSNALLEGDYENYFVEFVQVAAVAVAALECWIRQREERNGTD